MADNFITKEILKDFPNIRYWNAINTSNASDQYNCIAWVLEINNVWIWPIGDDNSVWWPKHIARRENKESFIKLFKYHGYNIIPNKDISLKSTMRKIALYTNSSKTPTHAARQLSNGMWASKIGADIDLVHKTLDVLEGPAYGKVDIIFGKQKFEYISAEESEIINKSNILLKMKNIGNNRYKF